MRSAPRGPHACAALSCERLLLAALRNGARGTVHSVFARVVNVLGDDRALWTLAARGLDDAPATVRIDVDAFDAAGVRVGDAVVASADLVRIGDRTAVTLGAATPWDARLPDYPVDTATLRGNVALLRAEAAAWTLRHSSTAPGVSAGIASTLLHAHGQRLGEALAHQDRDGARTHARALLGLGPGLTPAGDDFLLGVFAIVNLPRGPFERMKPVCGEIVTEAPSRTNAISLAALAAAARGRVRESIQALLCEMAGGRREAASQALARVLAIGATSGGDIVAGLLCALDAALQTPRTAAHAFAVLRG
jgi:hypothetical protein